MANCGYRFCKESLGDRAHTVPAGAVSSWCSKSVWKEKIWFYGKYPLICEKCHKKAKTEYGYPSTIHLYTRQVMPVQNIFVPHKVYVQVAKEGNSFDLSEIKLKNLWHQHKIINLIKPPSLTPQGARELNKLPSRYRQRLLHYVCIELKCTIPKDNIKLIRFLKMVWSDSVLDNIFITGYNASLNEIN